MGECNGDHRPHTPDDLKYRPLPAKASFQDELASKINK